MKRKYTVLFMLITAVIMSVFTAIPVSADMGPKPSIDLTIKNAPYGEYYVALLVDRYDSPYKENPKYTGAEKIIHDYYSDGWSAWNSALDGIVIHSSNEKHTYSFDYDVPNRFKVIVVTEDGNIYVSSEYEKKSYNAVIVYDLKKKEITENVSGFVLKTLVNFAFTLGVTLVIEWLIFLAFSFDLNAGKNKLCFFATNIYTQMFLYAAIQTDYLYLFAGNRSLLFAEGIIFATETIIYVILLKTNSRLMTVGYSILANGVSLFAGGIAYFFMDFINPP